MKKADEATRFKVNERAIQRDLEDIRAYFAEDHEANRELIYDRIQKGYVLVENQKKSLTNSEILTVCKILLESRSLTKIEMYPIIDKLLQCCVPCGNYKKVAELILYKGLSIEAVLDRFPTAEVLQHDDNGWLVKAEVYGDLIEVVDGGKKDVY